MVKLKQGDIIITNFKPQSGHEQDGKRPALVVSNHIVDEHTNFECICPITHTKRNNPFHVEIVGNKAVDGYILVEQVKSLDINSRGFQKVGHLDDKTLSLVLKLVRSFFENDNK